MTAPFTAAAEQLDEILGISATHGIDDPGPNRDRYEPVPPAGHPVSWARFAYPERLSRGVVLVKWWLLAIPQYAVVAVFAGGAAYTATGGSRMHGRPMPCPAA